MSVDALRWAFRVEGVQDAYEAFVLVTLANFADDYGVSFPKVQTLKAACRCSRRKVQYCLASLEERGLIIATGRRRASGQQTSSAYVLVGFEGRKLPTTAEEHPLLEPLYIEGRLSLDTIGVHHVRPSEVAHEGANRAHSVHGVGARGARGGRTTCAPRGAPHAHHEPSLEPSLEPPLLLCARGAPARGSDAAAPAQDGTAARQVEVVAGSSAPGHGHDPAVVALLREEAGEDEVARWLDHRQALGMPQMTARSARLLAGELREIRVRGTDPDDALRLARSRGWRSVRADWLPGGGS